MMSRIQESNDSAATADRYLTDAQRPHLKPDSHGRKRKVPWRRPGLIAAVIVVAGLFFILAFSGVGPFEGYKNAMLGWFQPNGEQDAGASGTISTAQTAFDRRTGEYKNWYLGLAITPGGVQSGNDGYGEFIILINNKDATDPMYAELLDFLKQDTTDTLPYTYIPFVGSFYRGNAEDRVDLERVQLIVDGELQPNPPQVCADFAERLHNNAERAGIRCGYVSLDIAGYDDPDNLGIASNTGHALNVFETTDKGLIYIDCTGYPDDTGPVCKDRVVNVQVGKEYNPDFLFPSGSWHVAQGEMGVVTAMYVDWDGQWR